MRRFILYLYGNKNIAGSLLGLGALVLYFFGVIHNFWLEIVLGSYGIGYLAMPNSGHIETDLNGRMDTQSIRSSLERLSGDIAPLVPATVLALVQSIKNSILTILPQLTATGSGDPNMYSIRETALDYLPATLKNYLALPVAYRNTYPVADGKTATTLLTEQLSLLDTKMKEIVQNVLSNNAQALLTNGTFLRDKFKDQNFLKPV